MTAPTQDHDRAAVTGGPFGYMVGRRGSRAVGVAELDGTNGWQVYHAGNIIATGLDQAAATAALAALPVPTEWSTTP